MLPHYRSPSMTHEEETHGLESGKDKNLMRNYYTEKSYKRYKKLVLFIKYLLDDAKRIFHCQWYNSRRPLITLN